jgi:competence protein ComEA
MGGFMKGGVMMKKNKKLIALLLVVTVLIAFVPATLAQEAKKININQASAEELTQLQGIGQKYAERIVQFRKEHGPFKSPMDITRVPGIGSKIFNDNKDLITVD